MIRSKPKTVKKRISSHQKLVLEADAWVKAIVSNRQGDMCLVPNTGMMAAHATRVSCGGPLQGAHILRKGGLYRSIRHELDNIVVLCRNHHMFWAHLYEHDFCEWIEQIYPGRIAQLKLSALFARPKVDLKELACILKSIYEQEKSR